MENYLEDRIYSLSTFRDFGAFFQLKVFVWLFCFVLLLFHSGALKHLFQTIPLLEFTF